MPRSVNSHVKSLKLSQPEEEYLTLEEMAIWLNVSEPTVRALRDEHRIPAGVILPGKANPIWPRAHAAVAKWMVEHHEQFERSDEETRH